jgi:hypothetical protein
MNVRVVVFIFYFFFHLSSVRAFTSRQLARTVMETANSHIQEKWP